MLLAPHVDFPSVYITTRHFTDPQPVAHQVTPHLSSNHCLLIPITSQALNSAKVIFFLFMDGFILSACINKNLPLSPSWCFPVSSPLLCCFWEKEESTLALSLSIRDRQEQTDRCDRSFQGVGFFSERTRPLASGFVSRVYAISKCSARLVKQMKMIPDPAVPLQVRLSHFPSVTSACDTFRYNLPSSNIFIAAVLFISTDGTVCDTFRHVWSFGGCGAE